MGVLVVRALLIGVYTRLSFQEIRSAVLQLPRLSDAGAAYRKHASRRKMALLGCGPMVKQAHRTGTNWVLKYGRFVLMRYMMTVPRILDLKGLYFAPVAWMADPRIGSVSFISSAHFPSYPRQ